MASLCFATSWSIKLTIIHTMLSATFVIGLSDFSIREFNDTDNLTEIQIWACHLKLRYELRIVDVPMTWPEAMTVCSDLGYQTIQCAMSNWLTRFQVKHYLEFIEYSASNYSFWTGYFRPYYHVTKLYQNWGTGCIPYDGSSNLSGNLTDGLCVVIQKTTNSSLETTVIEDCTKEHPFVCFRGINGVVFQAYEGFHINNLTIGEAYLESFEEFNITDAIGGVNASNMISDNTTFLEQCLEYCSRHASCNGVTFDTTNSSSPRCIFIIGSAFYYNLTLEINMTHYAKSDCSVFLNNTFPEPESNRTFASLSDCGVDEIPESYYPCVPGCPVEDLTSELIAALTLDKRSTTKYHRKYVSIQDERPSARSMGAVGIIIIILFISMFPLFDILNEAHKKAKKKVRKKSKR